MTSLLNLTDDNVGPQIYFVVFFLVRKVIYKVVRIKKKKFCLSTFRKICNLISKGSFQNNVTPNFRALKCVISYSFQPSISEEKKTRECDTFMIFATAYH